MNKEHTDTVKAQTLLEQLTQTLLYEGYALYPYHRSAIKNQKPIPFGVVYPQAYTTCHEHALSYLQTQCIVTGSEALQLNIQVKFLHLKKIALFEKPCLNESVTDDFNAVSTMQYNEQVYSAGWQTVERELCSGDLSLDSLMHHKKCIPFTYGEEKTNAFLCDEKENIKGKQATIIAEIKGMVTIEANPVKDREDAYQITVGVANTTPVQQADTITRDDVLLQSFLSTHIILTATNALFISHQNPDEQWVPVIAACENINTWPILIEESNTTLLCSPIILYDYPQINAQSSGDFFDSTEIEEALLLHMAVLSEEEKNRIGQSDEKLHAMLNKVSQITPEELMSFHSNLKDSSRPITTEKKSER